MRLHNTLYIKASSELLFTIAHDITYWGVFNRPQHAAGSWPAAGARNVRVYEPHMTQSSLFLMEHTMAAMRRSFSASASIWRAASARSPPAAAGPTCQTTTTRQLPVTCPAMVRYLNGARSQHSKL